MKLIQTYNTFEGTRYNNGFVTFREMIKYWKKSIDIHLKLNYDVKIYTDIYGFKKIQSHISSDLIEVIEFEHIDDRFSMIGKIQTLLLQNKPFIHVDIDATLYEYVNFNTDVICEFIKNGKINKDYDLYKIPYKYVQLLACGIVGFNDIKLCKKYCKNILDNIKKVKNDHITYSTFYTLEEAYLSYLIDNNNKTYSIIKYNYKYEHLLDTKIIHEC